MFLVNLQHWSHPRATVPWSLDVISFSSSLDLPVWTVKAPWPGGCDMSPVIPALTPAMSWKEAVNCLPLPLVPSVKSSKASPAGTGRDSSADAEHWLSSHFWRTATDPGVQGAAAHRALSVPCQWLSCIHHLSPTWVEVMPAQDINNTWTPEASLFLLNALTTCSASEATSFFLWLYNSLTRFACSVHHGCLLHQTSGYFSPIGVRSPGPSSYVEDAVSHVDAKPRKAGEWTPLNLIRFFALVPLADYGFERFRNLLKVKAKTIQQICLCCLGYSPKICLLVGKSGVPS